MVGESVISQITIDKFLYHIPENRQAKRSKPLGMDTTSRINRWVHGAADKLYPIYIAKMNQVLSSNYIQVYEITHFIKLIAPSQHARVILGWFAQFYFLGYSFYYDKGSRSHEVILKLLKDYKGALKTDGYAGYNIYEDKSGVFSLGYMSHVRRKFENALETTPEAQRALDYLALLYVRK